MHAQMHTKRKPVVFASCRDKGYDEERVQMGTCMRGNAVAGHMSALRFVDGV